MPKFSHRLKELRISRDLSQQKLADILKISKSSINMYERGEREPGLETIEAIADYFNVDLNYLLGASNIPNKSFAPYNTRNNKGVKIPVLGKVQAGIPIEAIEEIVDYEEISKEMASKGTYFALLIRGDSMQPRMLDGDVIIVRQQEQVENGDIAVVLVNGNDATVKKIKRTETGIQLIPFNPTFDILFYTNEEIEKLPVRIVGKVVELRGKI